MPSSSYQRWCWGGGFALCLALATLSPSLTEWFQYQRLLIAEGQLWRLFTAHYVHLNLSHACLNASGMLVLLWVFEKELRIREWTWILLAVPMVISAGLWWRQPELQGYVGFSGVLHALIYAGLIRMWPSAKVLATLGLLVMLGRQVWEQTLFYNPDYLQTVIHGRVMPDAHLFGAMGGVFLGFYTLWRDRELVKLEASRYSSGTGQTPDA